MKKKIEKYTSEFRKEAVRLALQTDQPKTKNQNITVKYQNLEEENRALRAKIKRIEQERDILKKAAAYFASQDL